MRILPKCCSNWFEQGFFVQLEAQEAGFFCPGLPQGSRFLVFGRLWKGLSA